MVKEYRRGMFDTNVQNFFPLFSYSYAIFFLLQHANEDVEKMILGNKCDMTDKRVVNKERGEAVRIKISHNLKPYFYKLFL